MGFFFRGPLRSEQLAEEVLEEDPLSKNPHICRVSRQLFWEARKNRLRLFGGFLDMTCVRDRILLLKCR